MNSALNVVRRQFRGDAGGQFEQPLRLFGIEFAVLALAHAVFVQQQVAGRLHVALRTHSSGQPSSARMGRPERAMRTRWSTLPPTPAMQDISARSLRSSFTAMWLAICAALEQPEQA